MSNPTQFERYQRLLEYIDSHFSEPLTAETIESQCFYSYRNINRIFYALNNETIGQYIKRLRIEKAAEYLKYSDTSIADIAINVGFSDTASFSKAFKKTIGTAPTSYREVVTIKREMELETLSTKTAEHFSPMEHELVEMPEFQVLYSQYRGSYENIKAMTALWKEHINFGIQHELLDPRTLYLAEILDDRAITSSINCRYNAAFTIDTNADFTSRGQFRRKTIPGGDYAKFIHHGSHASSKNTYNKIYGQWMQYIGLEFEDKATLEIYSEDADSAPESDLITEIYIPVKSKKPRQ